MLWPAGSGFVDGAHTEILACFQSYFIYFFVLMIGYVRIKTGVLQ